MRWKPKGADDTLVIFTSDNGGVVKPAAGEQHDRRVHGRRPQDQRRLRGGNHDVWDGGFRVPPSCAGRARCLPERLQRNVGLVDHFATTAAIVGGLRAGSGRRKLQSLPAILDTAGSSRAGPALPAQRRRGFAIRKGPWKWVEGQPVSNIKPGAHKARAAEFQPQLYHLQQDPAETTDVSATHPEVVQELSALLNRYRDGGYSREMPPVIVRSYRRFCLRWRANRCWTSRSPHSPGNRGR